MTQLTRASIERIRDDSERIGWYGVRDLATTCLGLMDERDTLLTVRIEEMRRSEARIGSLRLERDAAEHNRLRDNEYQQARIRDLEEGLRSVDKYLNLPQDNEWRTRLRALLSEQDEP